MPAYRRPLPRRGGDSEMEKGRGIVALMTLSRGSSSFVTPVDIGGSLPPPALLPAREPSLVSANLILKPGIRVADRERKGKKAMQNVDTQRPRYHSRLRHATSQMIIGERYSRRGLLLRAVSLSVIHFHAPPDDRFLAWD